MNLAETILVFANMALAVWYVCRKCLSRHGVEFNHVLAFTVGFLFYWIIPIALGIWRFFESFPTMDFWYGIFDGIKGQKLIAYLLICLAAYVCFICGTEYGERRSQRHLTPKKRRPLNINLMDGYLLLACVLFIPAALSIRGQFFRGYTSIDEIQDLYVRSTFGAVMVFSMSLWIIYTSMRHQKLAESGTTLRVFANKFLILYMVAAVLAISMGSRYMVISAAFIVATYCSVYIKKWRASTMFTFAGGILVFALAIGAVRAGFGATGALGDILFSGLAETLNGALSLTYFLGDYAFAVVRWPIFLLSDYIYLVPRIILPSKDTLVLNPENYGFHILNPVGGVNSFVSFMINFGALGTMVFLFLFSFGLAYLKSRRHMVLARAMYSMLSGWVLISFFRNPFEVSLVKDIFQMSIVIPTCVVLSVYFFSSSLGARHSDFVKTAFLQRVTETGPSLPQPENEGNAGLG